MLNRFTGIPFSDNVIQDCLYSSHISPTVQINDCLFCTAVK